MDAVTFQRLFPAPAGGSGARAHLDAASYLASLELRARLPAGGPRVLSNFVTSLDGNATFQGGSTALSDPGDRSLFHALRGSADAIMAGTGTLAAEGYRPAGKPVVTMSRSGTLPRDIPLFQQAEGRVIVFSAEPPDLEGVGAEVSVEPLGDNAAMLARLRDGYGIDVLLCEGGPGVLGSLVRAELVDDLFLTIGPKLTGGSAGPGMTSGDPADALIVMDLADVIERAGTLYLHYTRTAGR